MRVAPSPDLVTVARAAILSGGQPRAAHSEQPLSWVERPIAP